MPFILADNLALLTTVNHAWIEVPLRDAKTAGFGLKRISLVNMPASFTQNGSQLGLVVYQRLYRGPILLDKMGGEWL